MVEKEMIKKSDLLEYTFCDDQQKLNVVLNVEYLKKLFNADIILLEETEHR